MKVKFTEHEGCFAFELEAETKEEVVKLARFGIGKLKELRGCHAFFDANGNAVASVVIGKSRKNSSML